MATFNLDAFLGAGGSSGGIGAIGTAFGVPTCILNIAGSALRLLPSSVLAAITEALNRGAQAADAVIKRFYKWLRDLFGIIEWDNEDGIFGFISNIFKLGSDQNVLALIEAIGAITRAVEEVANVYANIQALARDIEQIKNCIKSYGQYLKHKYGVSEEIPRDPKAFDNFISETFAVEKLQIESALKFIDDANKQINLINDILNERLVDPTKEPKFRPEYCYLFSGTIIAANCLSVDTQKKEIFRLVYGPPKSTQGQFILSNDGLYFDSQTSGIKPALTYLKNKATNLNKADRWRFAHDPNIGGKGKGMSVEELKNYFNTILDPKHINENVSIVDYYNKDGFLQELIGNKNKRIYDLSAQLNELEESNAPTSVILNFKQSIISENAQLNEKINKRKKQIELAVSLPAIYGTEVRYSPGEVPLNDFSYLGGLNITLSLQKQKELSFSQVDISGVVSPIQTNTYVISPASNKDSNFEHLIITDDGSAAIIYDGSSVSSTNSVIWQSENSLTTDSLIAAYNFLDTNVELPSSMSFTSRNSASIKDEYYAQLVAQSPSDVFSRGLGIPYLHGITKHSSVYPNEPSALGSFVKLQNQRPFNDLLYNRNGATIDFWVHLPNAVSEAGYNSNNVSSLYRLVLANENVGYRGDPTNTNTEFVQNDFTNKVVRGFLMGFTRDRRLTSSEPASLASSANPASSTVFFIAPTQSVTSSSIALVNRSYFDSDDCSLPDTAYHSMVQPLNTLKNGMYLSSCSNNFSHIAVTFNPKDDEINFYFDGKMVNTSSMSEVFGIEKYSMPNLPTFAIRDESFEYNAFSVGPNAPTTLKTGPKLDTYFTPWIIGGGYTDGMYNKGNFMGGTYGGITSGLRGYLGSFKLYKKALSSEEVINNYNTQKDFFKNIDIQQL